MKWRSEGDEDELEHMRGGLRGGPFGMHVRCGADGGEEAEVVIYGSSPAAVAAAVQAGRMGRSAVGVALGLLSAWGVLSNLQTLVEQLAHFGVEVFPKAVYGLDSIPHRLVVSDVVWVVATVYVFGLLASFVPAMLAACKKPVDALGKT